MSISQKKSAIAKVPKPGKFGFEECHVVSNESRQRLDGNMARRSSLSPGMIWDTDLAGFGLRVHPTGYKCWIVKHRERGRQRLTTLGSTVDVTADAAREQARGLLERCALDGLPSKPKQKPKPSFAEFAVRFWAEYARYWKPSTEKRNALALRNQLLPEFGSRTIDAIVRSDIIRWRDSLSNRQGIFNRALPVLAVMLGYAEQTGLRKAGSNPCKGTPRYKRQLPDRYLSAAEYARLARVLADAEGEQPVAVTAIRLLMFTGARSNEIVSLRWEDVDGSRLILRDSKTGPKTVWLNRPAIDALSLLPRASAGMVFLGAKRQSPIQLYFPWDRIRRAAALPDVRLHDLRHSFASIAIADGMPLTMIGRLLGHALPETTARYAHLADDVVADAAARVSDGIADALGLGK